MARIDPLPEDMASAEQKQAIEEELRLRGRMTNLKRIQAHSPAALRIYGEWFTLKNELSPFLSDREIFLFSLAISEAQKATIPIGFFRRALAGMNVRPGEFTPEPVEILLQRLGHAIGTDAHAVPDELWVEFEARYDAPVLTNLVAFAGIMVATTVFANLVRATPDAEILPFLDPPV